MQNAEFVLKTHFLLLFCLYYSCIFNNQNIANFKVSCDIHMSITHMHGITNITDVNN